MAITKDGYDRIEYLREIVNDGEDAKAVLKYASKYRDTAEKDFLKVVETENDKEIIAEAISDYKAVVRFCNMLQDAVMTGERKEKALVKELHKPSK